jgi:hypothetical protein
VRGRKELPTRTEGRALANRGERGAFHANEVSGRPRRSQLIARALHLRSCSSNRLLCIASRLPPSRHEGQRAGVEQPFPQHRRTGAAGQKRGFEHYVEMRSCRSSWRCSPACPLAIAPVTSARMPCAAPIGLGTHILPKRNPRLTSSIAPSSSGRRLRRWEWISRSLKHAQAREMMDVTVPGVGGWVSESLLSDPRRRIRVQRIFRMRG